MLRSNNFLYIFCRTSNEIGYFLRADLDSLHLVHSEMFHTNWLSVGDEQPVISCAHLIPLNVSVIGDGEFDCSVKHT